MVKLLINGEYRSSSICMKVIEYYVSIINVTIIDANNPDKNIFANNVLNLLFTLMNFNLFLLIVQHFVKTLFQFI